MLKEIILSDIHKSLTLLEDIYSSLQYHERFFPYHHEYLCALSSLIETINHLNLAASEIYNNDLPRD